jgi:hypothetical protein
MHPAFIICRKSQNKCCDNGLKVIFTGNRITEVFGSSVSCLGRTLKNRCDDRRRRATSASYHTASPKLELDDKKSVASKSTGSHVKYLLKLCIEEGRQFDYVKGASIFRCSCYITFQSHLSSDLRVAASFSSGQLVTQPDQPHR